MDLIFVHTVQLNPLQVQISGRMASIDISDVVTASNVTGHGKRDQFNNFLEIEFCSLCCRVGLDLQNAPYIYS